MIGILAEDFSTFTYSWVLGGSIAIHWPDLTSQYVNGASKVGPVSVVHAPALWPSRQPSKLVKQRIGLNIWGCLEKYVILFRAVEQVELAMNCGEPWYVFYIWYNTYTFSYTFTNIYIYISNDDFETTNIKDSKANSTRQIGALPERWHSSPGPKWTQWIQP